MTAFAPVLLVWSHDTGVDLAKTNVNGGAIAIGHPLGASRARIMTTLVNGGMASATIIERLA